MLFFKGIYGFIDYNINHECDLVTYPGPGLLYDDLCGLSQVGLGETAGVVPGVRLQAAGDGED